MRPFLHSIIASCVIAGSVLAGGFSRLPIGARTVTLGSSLVSFADDPNLVFYNPAGIAPMTSLSISTSYTRLFPGIQDDDLQYFSGSAVLSLKSLGLDFLGNVGIGLNAFNSSAWKEEELVGSYGQEFAEFLTVGGSVKLLHWSVPPPSGRLAVPEPGLSKLTMSFDVGVQSMVRDFIPDNDLRFGIAFSDINRPSIASDGSSDGKLDLKMAIGATYISRAYDYAATVHYTVAGPVKRFGVGTELVALKASIAGQQTQFIVRVGGGGLLDPGRQGDVNGGFGLIVAGFALDYAYTHQTELLYIDGTHHLSLRYDF